MATRKPTSTTAPGAAAAAAAARAAAAATGAAARAADDAADDAADEQSDEDAAVAGPKTLAEWRAYAEGLPDEAVVEVVEAANTTLFVRTLQDEGYSAAEIHTILIFLARRGVASGERLSSDGLYDLATLAATPPPVAT